MDFRVVAVVGLVVLTAGCSSLVGGEAETPTVTPAEVPTPEPTPTDQRVGIAPGLSTSNVTHPAFLARSHAEAADNESYSFVQRYHEDRQYQDVRTELDRSQHVVVENATVYRRNVSHRLERVIDGELRSLYGYAEYADGKSLYRSWLSTSNTDRVYRRYPDPAQPRTSLASIPLDGIRRYLTLESATVSRVTIQGSDAQHFSVRGTRSSLPSFDSVENYSAHAVIREDGFVRSLDVSYDARNNGRRITARFTFRYTDVGTATVTPPPWADEARAIFADD